MERLRELLYPMGDNRVSLPDWCLFLIELGYRVAEANDPDYRTIAGLALPTRSFASPFVALGAVLGRAKIADTSTVPRLRPGTPVLYRQGSHYYQGAFCGYETMNDKEYLVISVHKKGSDELIIKVPPSLAPQVHPREESDSGLHSGPRARPIRVSGFAKYLLDGKLNPYQFATESRLDCAVIGHLSRLRHEVNEAEFALYVSKSKLERSTLQEILRISKFNRPQNGYRCKVFRPDGAKGPQIDSKTSHPVVIFDGASGFLRWREPLRAFDWIVLLDKTEQHFSDAANALNDEYIQRRATRAWAADVPPPPPSIELELFEEPRS